ncbi:putative reverse transcriptase domain-containing protein [Tanacetum coccineum]|uniref:Reverse transcriptase domain-containing protein n=1 Tax=Tanacetum coccineum TaxID=301880 RepID=A0ABQ5GGK3_9ASTR
MHRLQLPIRSYLQIRMDHHRAPPLLPAYVHDPMELDEHVPVYIPELEHLEYHVPSDDDIQDEDQPYANDALPIADEEHESEDEDHKEDPNEEHEPEDEDHEEDPSEEHEPKEEDTEEEEPFEGSNETEPFEEDETAITPPPPRHHGARISVRPQPPMAASTEALIDAFTIVLRPSPPSTPLIPSTLHQIPSPPFPLPPTSPTYDQAPLVESSAAAARPPRGRYDFVDTIKAGQGLICSPGHDARTIARAADRAEDIGYVRALQASEHRMMTSIEEVNLRDAHTNRRDIRLEIDVVRGQKTSYETELHESAKDRAIRHMMCTHVLEARAQIDTVEDTKIMPVTRQGANDAMTQESIQAMIDQAIQRNSTHTQDDTSQSSGGGLRRPVQPARVCSYTDFMKCQPLNFKGTEGVVGLSQWLEKMESVFHISGCAIDNQVKFATCTLLGAALTWWNGHVRTLGHDAAYAMTWGTLKKKLTDKYCPKGEIKKLEIELWNLRTEKVDKYISGLPDNIHGNVMSARPKTLDDAIELANDLMDQKLRTYAERQNDNKRKVDDSSRNNQQPHKKQNVARAYTVGPGEKKAYTGNLPLCTKCNYHYTGQCAPKCGNCKRYGHATNDCRVNTNNNNNNKNQKTGACYECGNTGHIKKNCLKLKNRGNGTEMAQLKEELMLWEEEMLAQTLTFDLANYKRGLASVEEQLVFYKKNEGMLCDQIAVLKRDASFNESEINALKIQIERLKKEKESYGVKVNKSVSENSSNEIKKTSGAPIIEDWVSDCDEDETLEKVSESTNVQKPKQADQPRKISQNPRNNNCDFHDKKMVQKPVLNNVKKGTGQREVRPVWNNAMRTNHQNFSNSRSNFAPTAGLTKSGLVPISTARQSSSRAAALVRTARPIKTDAPKPFVNVVKSKPNTFQKSHSPSRRSFYQHTSLKNRNLNNRVNTVKVNSVNTAKGKRVISVVGEQEINDVKSKACWVWRPKIKVLDHVSKNNGSYICKQFDYVDPTGLEFKVLVVYYTTNGHQFTMSNRQERIGYSRANDNWINKIDCLLSSEVGDEAVHKELGDRMERAATTAFSFNTEQDSDAQTRFEAASKRPMIHLSQEVTHLEVGRTV